MSRIARGCTFCPCTTETAALVFFDETERGHSEFVELTSEMRATEHNLVP